jgi:polar amino acid transport system substrate-binding protein
MRSTATLLLLAAALPVAAAETTLLRVGMDTRQAPWAYVQGFEFANQEEPKKDPVLSEAQLKKVVGLDVDVMNALARRLGTTAVIVPTSWFGLEEGLLAKRYDIILSSWTPSPKTPATILASGPYYEWGLLIAVRAEEKKIQSYQDLAGVKVGHYKDPAVERTLRSMGAAQLVAEDDAETLFTDLKQGTLPAIVFDSLYVRWRVANDASFRSVGEPLNRLGYHVGVRKEDAALFKRVEAAVKDLMGATELKEIRARWEGPTRK